ncbi:lipopolysaccharide biosynthesis protein [Heyndrickxia coagulans]|uniref:lipopolysaccharide biosynthesis protein n=1 Tax=Heyndrickxia coagulans TaxID=1398 RepID=UPI0015C6095F|nr:hypothetical protein [Heyndrickxia coagulans]
MNQKILQFFKNFSYTFLSNIISLFVSTTVILIIPKIIGVTEYGYWQLYLFYSSYVGFLHLGWNDGVYLRYGGEKYESLNKKLFFSQFWILASFQFLIGLIIFFISNSFSISEKIFIIQMVSVCMVIVNIRCYLVYILQCTNRIKEYATITLMERILYILLILILIVCGINNYKIMIVADLIGKFLSLLYSIYCCKDIVIKKVENFSLDIHETFTNINVGSKLMFSNIANMLVIGIVRFGIEHEWDVKTFGKISLTLSISNMLMIFVSAVGIIMFPILRRTGNSRLAFIYKTVRLPFSSLLLLLLILYYPINTILRFWLPTYSDSLKFMIILFPICVYEGKMSLLINTYLKTLRKEKSILFINLLTVLLSIILTTVFAVLFKSLTLTVITIVVLLTFRCMLAELLLTKLLSINLKKVLLEEMLLTVIYIYTGWYLNPLLACAIYLASYIVYLFVNKKEILSSIKDIKVILAK